MKNVIILDLDGTLFNINHRVHLAQAKAWDEFHSLMRYDKVEEAVKFLLVLANRSKVSVIALTGRNENYRKATESQIYDHDLDHLIDEVLMRKDGDQRSDDKVKLEMIAERFGSLAHALDRVAFILEDRDSVVAAYRGVGFDCWQVKPAGY